METLNGQIGVFNFGKKINVRKMHKTFTAIQTACVNNAWYLTKYGTRVKNTLILTIVQTQIIAALQDVPGCKFVAFKGTAGGFIFMCGGMEYFTIATKPIGHSLPRMVFAPNN